MSLRAEKCSKRHVDGRVQRTRIIYDQTSDVGLALIARESKVCSVAVSLNARLAALALDTERREEGWRSQIERRRFSVKG